MRFSVTSRRPGGVGQPPRQAAGHYGEWLNWANALEQPPASLRGGLRQGLQISVRSLTSRKDALCPTPAGCKLRLSVRRRSGVGRVTGQSVLFREGVYAECALPYGMGCRMRFSVTSRRPGGVGQPPARLRGTMENGPTGQMRSSNPPPACGAGCARVRRSRFGVWPHGKAHSGCGPSRN